MKDHWRKGRIKGDGGFSLVELPGEVISCRRCNVRLFLLGPVTDYSLLFIPLPGTVINNSFCD